MNTKEEEKREAMNMLPICSHERRNGEGRRRGKLTKFRSRGRGRREQEDDVLDFSWDAFNPHLQGEKWRRRKKKKLQQLQWRKGRMVGLGLGFKMRVGGEKSKMPLWVKWEKINYLRDFGASNHDEPRTKDDERDEIFPTSSNSAKTELFEKIPNFPINHNLTPY